MLNTHKKKDKKTSPAYPDGAVEPPKGRTRMVLGEQIAAGKALRQLVPLESHSEWTPPGDRRAPLDILEEQDNARIPSLVPIRFGRMLQSPFAFLRGSAAVMAADLAGTPTTGPRVQACGDCHLVNFGAFATPERNIIFDINDFDETLPAPWEWDLKRLAASFVVAGRNNGLAGAQCREVARETIRTYRTQMAEFARMYILDVWYARLDLETILAGTRDAAWVKSVRAKVEKAVIHNVPEYEFPRLAERKGGKAIIKDNPPLIYHAPELGDEHAVLTTLEGYRESLQEDRRALFDHYQYVDSAIKVVGVGSVGTLCAVGLFIATDNDPLFLQIKQANPSVLEPFAGKSLHKSHGERVVAGQRLMQSASDIFLGWAVGGGAEGRHFYVRQLRDMKGKPEVGSYNASRLSRYAQLTGWTLARAHARSGDAGILSGYMGKSDTFDRAIEQFAVRYADQTERDHKALVDAVHAGRIEVRMEG